MWLPPYHHILTHRVNLNDYPPYAAGRLALDQPGTVLAEHYVLQGIRWAVVVGYACSAAHFFLFYRRRLSVSERQLAHVHSYCAHKIAYFTPVGILGGVFRGAVVEHRALDEETLRGVYDSEVQVGQRTLEAYNRRRAKVLKRAQQSQPWWVTPGAWLGMCAARDERLEQLLVSRGWRARSVKDLLVENSLSWVAATSHVEDSRWYSDRPAVTVNIRSPSAAPPPREPCFSKMQSDWLVSRSMQVLGYPGEDRWFTSAFRFGVSGMVCLLIAWNRGGVVYRMSMGLGCGVSAAAVISALHLDDIWGGA